ncbi:hypothetical protein K8R66_02850 [bacterium]|nr:hypothetical protein [bacterium]
MKNHNLLLVLIFAVIINYIANWHQSYADEKYFISNETDPEKIIIPEKVEYIELNDITTLEGIIIPNSARQLNVPALTHLEKSFNGKNLISIFADNIKYKNFHYQRKNKPLKYVRLKNNKLYF